MTATNPTAGTSASVTFIFDRAELRPDELYAGVINGDSGSYHLIVLPGEARGVTWQQAKVIAAVLGGQLPTLAELALICRDVRGEFPADGTYWLSEAFDSKAAFYYDVGARGRCDFESHEALLCARAVRRVYVRQRQQGDIDA